MDRIHEALSVCDLFVAIGTSGHVYPAAGFVQAANHCGACTIEINLEPSAVVTQFDECRQGLASTCVPELVAQILVA
jgi:NAD-dependent deacetylase